MGRRKIHMEKIGNLHGRQICFSKRRKGLFSKATELCNQGGGEVAIVIFSSAGNLYCYGWPSVDSVVRRYFKRRFASAAADSGSRQWWDAPVEGLELHELEVLHAMLGELKEKAEKRAAQLLIEGGGDDMSTGKASEDHHQSSLPVRLVQRRIEQQARVDDPLSDSKLARSPLDSERISLSSES
ncbi:hypothetical protein Taro_017968 [Colocasia esculenta]|uniref:MADS-box domain-containing protein n=1 Tax=Colocasia esculenta TaxID=4460 RepID=A0A843V103_COLES|nr:hypothetical protein [Colocasia esculenta]